MAVAVITGSAGLIGAEASRLCASRGLDVVGIDNDMRSRFFGPDASTLGHRASLEREVRGYHHVDADIRDGAAMRSVFDRYGRAIRLVIHAAAQPSHDWSAREPVIDFSINADATLALLDLTRRQAPDAVFVFTSTNKVYGDAANRLPFVEHATRWEVEPGHPYAEHGIDESMSVDGTCHSPFGVSKLAADMLVQEYGHYFGMRTGCFRGGCLTGSGHAATQLHGFLAYVVRCALTGTPYTVIGYKGKQVRDILHARDLVAALWAFFEAPRVGAVYNLGGGRFANCSVLEALAVCERVTGRAIVRSYEERPRVGDHMWWISDTRKFRADYPSWRPRYDVAEVVAEIADRTAA